MPISVIVGGQFGSEGKGKVAYLWAQEKGAKVAIRVGGPNSGHTVVDPSGKSFIFRHLPTAALLDDVICILAPGSYINPSLLQAEINSLQLQPSRLMIDPNAVIVSDADEYEEQTDLLRESIGSTLSGTGAAVKKRISRGNNIVFAKDDKRLSKYVQATSPFLHEYLNNKGRIIIEGTQGFGLSLLHSPYYPKVTSRDTTAAAFVSEAGLSPIDVDEVVLVLRSFPIRVAGNSGPLSNEIDWNILTHELESPTPIIEYTSVTKAVRRVARFDPEIVKHAIMINKPTHIIMNHLDYVAHPVNNFDRIKHFLFNVESQIERKIDLVGTSPSTLINPRELMEKAFL